MASDEAVVRIVLEDSTSSASSYRPDQTPPPAGTSSQQNPYTPPPAGAGTSEAYRPSSVVPPPSPAGSAPDSYAGTSAGQGATVAGVSTSTQSNSAVIDQQVETNTLLTELVTEVKDLNVQLGSDPDSHGDRSATWASTTSDITTKAVSGLTSFLSKSLSTLHEVGIQATAMLGHPAHFDRSRAIEQAEDADITAIKEGTKQTTKAIDVLREDLLQAVYRMIDSVDSVVIAIGETTDAVESLEILLGASIAMLEKIWGRLPKTNEEKRSEEDSTLDYLDYTALPIKLNDPAEHESLPLDQSMIGHPSYTHQVPGLTPEEIEQSKELPLEQLKPPSRKRLGMGGMREYPHSEEEQKPFDQPLRRVKYEEPQPIPKSGPVVLTPPEDFKPPEPTSELDESIGKTTKAADSDSSPYTSDTVDVRPPEVTSTPVTIPAQDPAEALVGAAGDLSKAAADLTQAAEVIKRPRGHGPDAPGDTPPSIGPTPSSSPPLPSHRPPDSPTPQDPELSVIRPDTPKFDEPVPAIPEEPELPLPTDQESRSAERKRRADKRKERRGIPTDRGHVDVEEKVYSAEEVVSGGEGAKLKQAAIEVGPVEKLGDVEKETVTTAGGLQPVSAEIEPPKRFEETNNEDWQAAYDDMAKRQKEAFEKQTQEQSKSKPDAPEEQEYQELLHKPKLEAPEPQPPPPATAEPSRAAAKLLGLKPEPTPEQELIEERNRAWKHKQFLASQAEASELAEVALPEDEADFILSMEDNQTTPPEAEVPVEPEQSHPESPPDIDPLWLTWKPKQKPGNILKERYNEMAELGFVPKIEKGPYKVKRAQLDAFAEAMKISGLQPPDWLAQGGAVEDHPGKPKGTDTVPAWLSPGEFVVNSDAATANREELEEINQGDGKVEDMSDGGFVNYLAEGGESKDSKDKGKSIASRIGSTLSTTAGVGGTIVSGAISGGTSASADPSASLSKFGDTLSKVGAQIPGLGIAAVAAGESLKGISVVMDAITKTADRYGEYSPQIAQAQATAEIKQTMGDFRRAQEVGKDLSQFIIAQSDLQQKFEDIKVKMLMRITPAVTKILEFIEMIMPATESVSDSINDVRGELGNLVKVGKTWLGMEEDKKLPDPVDPTTLLFYEKFETAGEGTIEKPGWVPDR